MQATVAYFTRTGRSERVAQVLGRELEGRGAHVDLVRLEPIRGRTAVGGAILAALRVPAGLEQTPDLSGNDLLALVGPVWAASMTPAMRSMIEALPHLDGRPVISVVCGFHTCNGVAARMTKELQARDAGRVVSRAIGRSAVQDPLAVSDLARELCAAALGAQRQ